MAAYTVINGSDATLSAIDGGSTNVAPHTYKDGITLTNTQLAAVLTSAGVACVKDLTGVADAMQKKRILAVAGLVLGA